MISVAYSKASEQLLTDWHFHVWTSGC